MEKRIDFIDNTNVIVYYTVIDRKDHRNHDLPARKYKEKIHFGWFNHGVEYRNNHLPTIISSYQNHYDAGVKKYMKGTRFSKKYNAYIGSMFNDGGFMLWKN